MREGDQKAAARLLPPVPLRRKTPHYGDPPPSKANPQRKWSAGHSRHGGGRRNARLATDSKRGVS